MGLFGKKQSSSDSGKSSRSSVHSNSVREDSVAASNTSDMQTSTKAVVVDDDSATSCDEYISNDASHVADSPSPSPVLEQRDPSSEEPLSPSQTHDIQHNSSEEVIDRVSKRVLSQVENLVKDSVSATMSSFLTQQLHTQAQTIELVKKTCNEVQNHLQQQNDSPIFDVGVINTIVKTEVDSLLNPLRDSLNHLCQSSVLPEELVSDLQKLTTSNPHLHKSSKVLVPEFEVPSDATEIERHLATLSSRLIALNVAPSADPVRFEDVLALNDYDSLDRFFAVQQDKPFAFWKQYQNDREFIITFISLCARLLSQRQSCSFLPFISTAINVLLFRNDDLEEKELKQLRLLWDALANFNSSYNVIAINDLLQMVCG
ncbi:hypothetical protein P9112_006720 [Eukaryota sp. TZLM1-RC]